MTGRHRYCGHECSLSGSVEKPRQVICRKPSSPIPFGAGRGSRVYAQSAIHHRHAAARVANLHTHREESSSCNESSSPLRAKPYRPAAVALEDRRGFIIHGDRRGRLVLGAEWNHGPLLSCIRNGESGEVSRASCKFKFMMLRSAARPLRWEEVL